MAAATLNLNGTKFVVIPASEYRQLKSDASASRNGQGSTAKRRLSKQDRGDIAESARRLKKDKRIPAEEVFRKLGV